MNTPTSAINSDDCEREPIHRVTSIQSYGALLVLTPELQVLQASDNLGDFLQLPEPPKLPVKLEDLIGDQQAARIGALYVELPEGTHRSTTLPVTHDEDSSGLRVVAHRLAAQHSLEIQFEEHAVTPDTSPISALPAALQTALESSESLFLNAKLTTVKIANCIGYARVMVYRFHPDWSGEVIAETRRPDLTPYLGLRYPATDIPAQARRLYELNRVRAIAAVDAAPVALQPPNHPVTGEPPDMTYSILRSVPPTHIEYLQNMGVAATLSSAVMVNGQLWGMIACHHTEPRSVGWELREAFAQTTEVFAARVTHLVAREQMLNQERLQRSLVRLQQQATTEGNIVQGLLQFARNELSRGSGCVLLCGNTGAAVGMTPPVTWCLNLAQYLVTREPLYVTTRLSADYPAAERYRAIASGLAALRLDVEPPTVLLCFRQEIVREVNWGGDPSRPFERNEATQRVSPRKSFDLWRETVSAESRPWETHIVELLDRLPDLIVDLLPDTTHSLQQHINTFGRRYQSQQPELEDYFEGVAPEGMALLMVSEPERNISPLSVNQAFRDTFVIDFDALDGVQLGDFLDALGLPRSLLQDVEFDDVVECDSWSDLRGQRYLLIERKQFLETQTAEDRQSWSVLAFQDVTDLSRERESLKAARDHALINAEGLEQLVAKRTQALQLEIAERKRTQQALEQQRANLEQTVRERTAHLTVLNRDLQAEIAAHQQSDRALRESEQRYRSLFEFANDGIFIIEAGRCVDCNPKIPQLFGCQREDIIGRSLLEFSPIVQPNGTRSEALVAEKMALTQAGESQYFEWRYRRSDGTPFDADVSLTAVSEDNRSFIFALVRDITGRKRSERARERLLAELRRSNESLEQFAYITSHDLQEPLRKIRQFGERLLTNQQLQLPDKTRDYLERIHHSADYAQQLIRDLLAYSRITRRAQPFKPVALNEVVSRALAALDKHLQTGKAQLEIKPLPTVQGDRTLLIELFQNMLDNALKFTREGITPRISISAEPLADDVPLPRRDIVTYCRIVLEDNGIGFEQRYSERIFTIFQRLHDRQQYTGTGIGLAISKKIIEYHGGHIEAHSVVDQGTVFHITLPLQSRAHDNDSPLTLPFQAAIGIDPPNNNG
ncbi:MAG: ATP-binding protein [Candidatus Competibacteraceae bacterium]|nr:ATP-binding protein [Candidatus Competibacteraceae bacterium]